MPSTMASSSSLAGVMTLSALSGSAVGGILLGLAFVLGMTFPLFCMALAWDRLRLGERSWTRTRAVRLRIAGRTLVTNTVNIAVAAAFAVMGGLVSYLAGAEKMTRGPGFQVAIGAFLSRIFARIEVWTRPIPEPVLGLVVLAIAAGFVYATLSDRHRVRPDTTHPHAAPDSRADAPSCHHSSNV